MAKKKAKKKAAPKSRETNNADVKVEQHKCKARVESERFNAITGIAKAAATFAVFAAAILCLGVPLLVWRYDGTEQSGCWAGSMGGVSFLVGGALLIAAMVLCYLCMLLPWIPGGETKPAGNQGDRKSGGDDT